MQTRKITAKFLALFLALAFVLSACGSQPDGQEQLEQQEQPKQQEQLEETPPASEEEKTGLIDFTSQFAAEQPDACVIDEAAHTVTLNKMGGDHMAVYNGLEEPSLSFVLEADVEFPDGPNSGTRSAALTFGIKDKNDPMAKWYGANIDSGRAEGSDLFRVFGPEIETNTDGEKSDIDIDAPLHLKMDVAESGRFTYSFGNVGDTEQHEITGMIPNWAGGYVGILSWQSAARFSNITFENRVSANSSGQIDFSVPEVGDDNPILTGLTDFTSITPELVSVDETAKTVTVGSNGGDHFVMYNGLTAPTDSFVLEVDLTLLESAVPGGSISGALVFGAESRDFPNMKWYGANIDTGRKDATMFRVFGGGSETTTDGEQGSIDLSQPLHLRLEVRRSGAYKYSFGNVGDAELNRSFTGVIPNWEGGYIGILSFNSKVEFSNITFQDRSATAGGDVTATAITGDGFNTNLSDLTGYGGTWTVDASGLAGNTVGYGNGFAYSETKGTDFVYSTDITFSSDTGIAALIFRNSGVTDHANGYALSMDVGAGAARFMRWEDDRKCQLADDRIIQATADGKYTLKVVAVGGWMSCYVNDELIASSGDYIIGFRGQNTVPSSGYFGLQCTNANVVFQNTNYTELTSENTPQLKDITVVSSVGDVEKKAQFFPTSPMYIQYVKNNAGTVDLNVTSVSSDAGITVIGPDGTVYNDGKNIPVNEGTNYIAVNSVTTALDGTEIPLTYRVNVFRRQDESIYYNEPYRDQYHYSVKDSWGNDPNGLVYYNGTYHLFYQFATSTRWSTMHWAHATSPDLLHWEEQPIAFLPDANGVEYSGCIVADTANTSGLFSSKKGGLVAIITADGNGQRMQVAYSEDEGATWTKLDRIVLDWSKDPLRDQAFRDPKVFRWEGKWFLVVAGGPLRIYSSKNLIDWTVESTYRDLHTECPDLYPVTAPDGAIKWVLSRGGRYYKIGDFKEVGGKWTYVPDEAYVDEDGVMNFGRDSYAAMTYYVQDFGTAKKPTIPEIIEINWMNTWDYCNDVASTVGQNFNGTYNLNLKLGIAIEDGKYVLTQNPIDAYESLRGEKVVELKGVEVGPDNDLLSGLNGDCYEIIATFKPGEDTKKLGFTVRSDGIRGTGVYYSLSTGSMIIDRTMSGIQIGGNFTSGGRQTVAMNPDGTIDLHIFVDRASIEVFAKGGIAAGAVQIFPVADSLGASVLVEGDPVTADITIYTLNSIWD